MSEAERQQIKDSIKNEVMQTLPDRVERYLQVRGIIFVPDFPSAPFAPFAAPSVECVKLFRDGHYLGCITLAQAIVEAVIRYVWQIKLRKKQNQEGSFEKNLEALQKKKFISDEWWTKLDQMWEDRHSYHHLRPSVESDQKKLEETARNTLTLLNNLEQEFFGFTLREGMVVPNHPEYWSIENGELQVYMRG